MQSSSACKSTSQLGYDLRRLNYRIIRSALIGAGVIACLSMSIRFAWPQCLEDPSNFLLAVNQFICSALRLGVAFKVPHLKLFKASDASLDAIFSACVWLTQIAKDILVVVTANNHRSMQLSWKPRQAGISAGVYEIVHQLPLYTSGLIPLWVMLSVSTLDAAISAMPGHSNPTAQTWSANFTTFVFLTVLPSYVLHHANMLIHGKSTDASSDCDDKEDDDGTRIEQHSHVGPALILSPVQASRLMGDGFIDYSSPLFRQTQVLCSKIRTDLSIAQVPRDLAQRLEESLSNMSGRQFCLSDIAMREGCLLIRQELIAGDLFAPDLHPEILFGSHEQMMELVTAQLPHLQHVSESGGGTAGLHSGEYIQTQLGHEFVRCFWDADSQAWQFAQPPDVKVTTNTPANTAGLGQVRCVSQTPRDFMQSEHLLCTARTVANPPCHGVVEVVIEVQITGVVSEWSASLAHITGFTTAVNKKLLSGMNWASTPQSTRDLPVTSIPTAAVVPLQILVYGNGIYCETEVMCIQPLALGSSTAVATIRVELLAAVAERNTGHADQSMNCLSPLIIELWSTNTLLESASIVTLPAPTEQTAGQQPCQWRGSKPATVTAAMVEFSAATDELWRHDDNPQAVRIRCELNHDMRLWLSGIRDTQQAVNTTCKTGSGMTDTAQMTMMGGISFCQLSKLAQTLSAYASRASLPQLQRMIKEQLAYLSTCQPASQAMKRPAPTGDSMKPAVTTMATMMKPALKLMDVLPLATSYCDSHSGLLAELGISQCGMALLLLAYNSRNT